MCQKGARDLHVFIMLIAAAMLAVATRAQVLKEPQAEGLVAYWSFDEFAGELTPDASGNHNDARVISATQVKGVRNTGLEFDGRRSGVTCARAGITRTSQELTLEAWVKLASTSFEGFPTVIRKQGAYALRFAERNLGFLLWFEGAPVALNSANTDWQKDEWYHLVATYDGKQMRLFINGDEDKNSPLSRAGFIDATLDNCAIGSGGGGGSLQGVIDEVRIYHRALAPEEVRASYEYGRSALLAQKNVVVEPKPVGAQPVVFRKPRREIKMVEPGFIWIDAEDFDDYGGWVLDTQFVHLMGSAYLIAAGVGEPVADASAEVEVPQAGRYRLWVRAKNWLKEYSPGQFRVLVNEVPTEKVFGAAQTEQWTWESGGEFDLEKGKVRLALRDLTGYFARCDALILTTDLSYTPPEKVEDITKERARLTGLDLTPKLAGEFDVVVVGAGAAGCCAALAAARMGAKTALVQNRPVLGGNASSEMGVSINGAASSHPNARESGIIEEMGRIKARYGFRTMTEAFALAAEAEKNLSVFLNQHVFGVEMRDDKTIAAVRAMDTLTGTISVYRGKMFIDCTGDGWVGYYAGAKYRLGRESRDEFGESLAPEKADLITMSGCLMGDGALAYRVHDTGQPVKYVPPPWAPRFTSAEEFGRHPRHFTGGEWWLEHPGDIDDVWDAEKARDELVRISFGYWDYIKNVWPERERAANYKLVAVPILDAKRESRRLVGDYILTQNDVQEGKIFPDRISYGGWPLDVHHPKGIYSGKEGPFHCNPRVPIYTIPYRCLYSVNIDNLLFAGRDVSVTHIALGSVRVQGTLASLGQAAGTAAAMAVRHNTTPRGIYEKHLWELQQTLLKHDQYIPGIVNEDPLDLARKAKVNASSYMEFEEFGEKQVQPDESHLMNVARAVMFPRGMRKHLGSIHLLLSSELDKPMPIVLHVRGAQESGDFSSRQDLVSVEAAVPPKKQSWVEFKVGRDIETPFVWIWLEPREGISWRLMQKAPLSSCRAYGGDEAGWTVVTGQYYAFFTDPALALEADYRPENVVNGVTRIIGRTTNMWASDPRQSLPQWIELVFDTPTPVNTVYLTFDTDLNAAFHSVSLVPQCARDYELSCDDGSGLRPVVKVEGNFQRRRVHRFDTVNAVRLRLTVHATNGDVSARVFEIRAYKE